MFAISCPLVTFSNSFSAVSEAYMIGDVQIDDLDAVMEVRYFSFRKLADFLLTPVAVVH